MKPFSFTVNIEVERESGKFMPRDEVAEQLLEALEGADPGSVDGGPDGDSVMNVITWEVVDAS
jgi:hypothetical protein